MLNRRKKIQSSSSGNDWMQTYSDAVTLLLCFFVLLYSFSTINAQKWQQLVESFSGRVPVFDIIDPSSEPDEEEGQDKAIKNFNDLFIFLSGYIEENGLKSNIELIKDDNSISLRFRDTVLFDPDSYILKPAGRQILDDICIALISADELIEMIRIEGHTAANPKGLPPFKGTFEFSTYRATNVIKYMVEDKSMNPLKLCAAGYGQYHPIGDNETAEGRAKNRRVEIIITSILASNTLSGSSSYPVIE